MTSKPIGDKVKGGADWYNLVLLFKLDNAERNYSSFHPFTLFSMPQRYADFDTSDVRWLRNQIDSVTDLGREEHALPRSVSPIFFIFMPFSATNMPNNRLAPGFDAIHLKILDWPLRFYLFPNLQLRWTKEEM